jgi:hypothetical protein
MSDFTSVDVPSEIRCLALHGERDSAMTGQGSVGEGLNSGRDYQARALGRVFLNEGRSRNWGLGSPVKSAKTRSPSISSEGWRPSTSGFGVHPPGVWSGHVPRHEWTSKICAEISLPSHYSIEPKGFSIQNYRFVNPAERIQVFITLSTNHVSHLST